MRLRTLGIFGAGSIGCYLGGRLAASGVTVAMVGRAPLVTQVRSLGIVTRDLDGTERIAQPSSFSAGEDPGLLREADAVLVCVKSPSTAEAARALGNVVSARCVVISLQNGVRNVDVLREGLPGHTVIGGMVSFNVVRGPGPSFYQTTSGPLVLEDGPGARELAGVLASASFSVRVRADFKQVQWSKLLLNLNNAINALSGLPLKAQLSQRGYRRILAATQREALVALNEAGIGTVRLGRVVPRLAPLVLSLPDWLFFAVAGTMIDIDPQARSSMADDLERGRKTEIDYLNGEVVRLAAEVGTSAAVNRRVVELIRHAEEDGGGSPHLSAAELRAKAMQD